MSHRQKNTSPTIFLLRHGETDWNAIGKLAGHSNEAILTEKGKSQALEAGLALKSLLSREEKLLMCSSGMIRAHITAEIIASCIDYPKEKIQTHENLKEMDWGILSGVVLERHQSIHSYLSKERLPPEEHFITPIDFDKGESYEQVAKRAMEVIQKICNDHADHTIIIVCHGGVIKSIYGLLTMNYELPHVKNCAGLLIEGHPSLSPTISSFPRNQKTDHHIN